MRLVKVPMRNLLTVLENPRVLVRICAGLVPRVTYMSGVSSARY